MDRNDAGGLEVVRGGGLTRAVPRLFLPSFLSRCGLTLLFSTAAPLFFYSSSILFIHHQAASAWSLGQIGRHTSDHARALAEGDVLRHLLACMVHQDSSEDLKIKSKRALKAILAKCTHLQALQPLLREAPVKVQKYVLKQFASILPHDVEARRAFVQNGGLQFLQELNETVGGKLTEFITQINACYPPEIVEYYSPHYSKKLLDKIDDYAPAV